MEEICSKTFPKATWKCIALLASGALCTGMDCHWVDTASHLILPALLPARLPAFADSCWCCLFPLCFLLYWFLSLLPGLCLGCSMIRVHVFACDCCEKYLHYKSNVNIAHIQVSNSNQLKGMKGLHGRDCCASVTCCNAVPMWKCFQAVQHRSWAWLRSWRSFRAAGALLVCFCSLHRESKIVRMLPDEVHPAPLPGWSAPFQPCLFSHFDLLVRATECMGLLPLEKMTALNVQCLGAPGSTARFLFMCPNTINTSLKQHSLKSLRI